MNRLTKITLILPLSIVALGILVTAGAVQTASAQESVAEKEVRVLDEIIVSSRKREESLFKIPVAVTAFSANDIVNMGLEELPDLVSYTPGFHYAENSVGRGGRNNRRLIFRGMNPRTDRQTRQAATVFIDGAPMIGSEIGSTDAYERIEIIKGPQSAYFGRQTFSGAINAITKTPSNELNGRVSVETGSWGRTDFAGELSGPIVDDKFLYRINAREYSTDGEYKNSGDPSSRIGARSTRDVGIGLFFAPNEQFSAKLRIRRWRDEDGPSVAVNINQEEDFDFATCTPGGSESNLWAGGVWPCGTLPLVSRNRVGLDTTYNAALQTLFGPVLNSSDLIFDGVPKKFGLERNAEENSLILDWDFANGMTITSITAKHKDEYANFEDSDRRVTAGLGTCLPLLLDPTLTSCSEEAYSLGLNGNETFFQELRLTSSAEKRLRWMVGASYSDIENWTQGAGKGRGTAFATNPNAVALGTKSFFTPETTAFYGSIAFDITEQLTLNVEMRHQEDKVIEGTISTAGTVNKFEDTFTSENPRVILDFKPNDKTTLYASYAVGSQPGQFNAGIGALDQGEIDQLRVLLNCGSQSDFDCLVAVPEEEITSYEVGVKGLFWDGRAQVSAAVYMMDWQKIVAPNIVTITSTALPTPIGEDQNVQVNSLGGQADMSGLELEGKVLLSDHWQLDGTISIVNSEIGVFESPDAGRLLGFRQINGLKNEFSRYPGESGTLSLTYDGDVGTDKAFFVRGDYIYSGPTWMTNANVTKTAANTTANLRAGLTSDAWRLELYATNLFDEKGYNALQNFPNVSTGGGRIIFAGFIPRQSFGIRASFFF